ncbi:uncharacterized protein V1516DRAFT_668952 [Lipomyces oligophaga]|uniref:uncharacterized protein n=1 Tax=Lipomyces oligophaga TaxID=45792 RepID=UPI0034CD9515
METRSKSRSRSMTPDTVSATPSSSRRRPIPPTPQKSSTVKIKLESSPPSSSPFAESSNSDALSTSTGATPTKSPPALPVRMKNSSSPSVESPVPLTTRTRRRKHRGRRPSRNFATVLFHLLIYWIIYFVFFQCPGDNSSTLLCSPLNKVTRPVRVTLSPIVSPGFAHLKAFYYSQIQPYAVGSYDTYARAHLENLHSTADEWYGKYLKTYADSTQQYIEQVQPYYEIAKEFVSAQIIQVRKSFIPLATIAKEKAVYYSTIAWKHAIFIYKNYLSGTVASLYRSYVTPVYSRVTQKLGPTSSLSVELNSDYVSGATPGSTIIKTVVATPSVTPAAVVLSEEEREHADVIDSDITAWNEKFKQSGKAAVSSLSADLEEFFTKSRKELKATGRQNLTEVKGYIQLQLYPMSEDPLSSEVIQSIIAYNLPSAADDVHARAAAAATEVLYNADQIRDSTLSIFRTVTDVGLHELARKWAMLENITWKDWKEFKSLRDLVDDFARVIESIPIDKGVVRKILEDLDRDIDDWAEEVRLSSIALIEQARLRELNSDISGLPVDEKVEEIEEINGEDEDEEEDAEDEEDDGYDDDGYDDDDADETITATSTLTSTVMVTLSRAVHDEL